MTLPRLLFSASAFVLGWPVIYPALLWVLARVSPRPVVSTSEAQLPTLTVVLPTYQESSSIEARLTNLRASDYPPARYEVIVVDSGSNDGTADIAENFARGAGDTRIRVVREKERGGKAAAINTALRQIESELVVVTDATTSFEPDALRHVAANFSDPTVGAATGYFEVTGSDQPMENEEKSFWRLRNLLRGLEAEVDSTPFLSGELCCFRRVLIDALDADSLADDMNIALKVRRQGYRVVIDTSARFSEPRSAALEELTQTKSRRAAGGVQELLRARDMTLNPRYGLFGLLILPSAWVYYLPLHLPALAIMGLSTLRWLLALPLLLRILVVPAIAFGAIKTAPRWRAGLGMLLFNEYMFLRGWLRIFQKQGMDVRWQQERSHREKVETGAGNGGRP